LPAILLLCLSVPVIADEASKEVQSDDRVANQDDVPNNGEDATRPVPRLDIKYEFAALPHNAHQDTLTFRGGYKVRFSRTLEVGLRIDFPLVYGNVAAADNPDKKFQFGTGDLLTQAYIAQHVNSRFAYGVGAKVYWPTAYYEQAGTGKYRVIPLAAFRVSLPEISKGSFFEPIIKYDSDCATRYGSNHISRLQFGPELNFMLPKNWFITLYSSEEIVYDFIKQAWAIPFNFMVGTLVTKNFVVSLEFFIPMLHSAGYMPYDFKTEGRVGFFF
jgi:hypothetical protein